LCFDHSQVVLIDEQVQRIVIILYPISFQILWKSFQLKIGIKYLDLNNPIEL
jgi:hypothetical protein